MPNTILSFIAYCEFSSSQVQPSNEKISWTFIGKLMIKLHQNANNRLRLDSNSWLNVIFIYLYNNTRADNFLSFLSKLKGRKKNKFKELIELAWDQNSTHLDNSNNDNQITPHQQQQVCNYYATWHCTVYEGFKWEKARIMRAVSFNRPLMTKE